MRAFRNLHAALWMGRDSVIVIEGIFAELAGAKQRCAGLYLPQKSPRAEEPNRFLRQKLLRKDQPDRKKEHDCGGQEFLCAVLHLKVHQNRARH